MRKTTSGFTMIEVLVVVAIIGILATITFMGFGRYQADARDSARAGKATVISEALEKYYDKNGEYPSCPSVTGPATTVTTSVLPGIDAQALVAPQAESGTTNSVACTDLTNMSQADFFAYVGDTSSTCTTGQACLLYKLKYKQESTGQIVTLDSRRKTNIGPTDAPVCSASPISFTQINTSWTPVASATSYDVMRATDSAFTMNAFSQNVPSTSYSVTGLSANTTYYFRVRANTAVGTGSWCDTVTASTWEVGTPTITIGTVTTTSVNISWGSAAHASTYTAQRSTDQSNWTSTCLDITTTSCNFTGLTTGLTYYFRVMAKNGSYSSAWSATANATTLIGTPTVTYGSITTTTMAFNWSAVTNATRYESQYRLNGGAWSATINEGTNTTRTHGPTTQGTRIEVQVRAVNSAGNPGSWSSAVGTTLSVSTPGWNAWGRTEAYPSWQTWVYNTGGASLCPAGTSIYTQFRDGIYGSYWNPWGGWGSNGSSSSTLHYTSTIANYSSTLQTQIQGYCKNTASGAVSSTLATGVSTAQHTPPPGATLSSAASCVDAYSVRGMFDVVLTLQETSMNLNANSSVVTWTAYRRSRDNNYHTWNTQYQAEDTHSATVNGTLVYSGPSASKRFYSTYSVWATEALYNTSTANVNSSDSGSINIAHNADGTKTISGSVSDTFGAEVFGAASCSFNYTLSDLR